MGNLPRLSIGGWLVGPYHYFFYAAHGSLGGRNMARVEFVDAPGGVTTIPGDNYWQVPAKRYGYPAFSDIGINPDQVLDRAVELVHVGRVLGTGSL